MESAQIGSFVCKSRSDQIRLDQISRSEEQIRSVDQLGSDQLWVLICKISPSQQNRDFEINIMLLYMNKSIKTKIENHDLDCKPWFWNQTSGFVAWLTRFFNERSWFFMRTTRLNMKRYRGKHNWRKSPKFTGDYDCLVIII